YTAVFAMSDFYAVELIYFLHRQHILVPEDISVVGFDNTGLSETCYPQLTTVGQDAGLRARMAVKALKELKEGECENPVRGLPVRLIVRDSVKNMNG
ncbi:MAG: substrate-binding domain-containing protein, partial [Lachnospiraceae bacterium]|nr:substrate-binding domain-containing protein [Lachnospiraceae bacterium]